MVKPLILTMMQTQKYHAILWTPGISAVFRGIRHAYEDFVLCLFSRSVRKVRYDSFTVEIGKKLEKLWPFLYSTKRFQYNTALIYPKSIYCWDKRK